MIDYDTVLWLDILVCSLTPSQRSAIALIVTTTVHAFIYPNGNSQSVRLGETSSLSPVSPQAQADCEP